MRAKAYRFFIKYLASYLLILMIPITVLTLVVNNVFVNKLQAEVITGNLNSLDKLRYSMDDQLKWIEDMTRQLLTEDNSLTPYRISDHWGFKSWGITRELKRFQRLSPFIHEIWLYYKDENSVFTSSGVYTVPVLAKQIYTFDDLSEAQLRTQLNELVKPTVLPTLQDHISGKNYMRMFIPLYPNQKQSLGTLVYLIEEDMIHRLMSAYHSAKGSTWIFDGNNQLVTGLSAEGAPSNASISSLIQQTALSDSQTVTVEGHQYYLFYMQSKQSGWKYASLLPVSTVLQKVEQAQTWYLYGVAALLLIGGGLIYLSMLMNYKPIHQLRKDSMRVLTRGDQNLNEVETVRDILNQLAHHNKELDEKVKHQAFAARSHLLLSMLKGDYEDLEEILEYGEEIGFSITSKTMRVAIAELPAHGGGKQSPSIEEMEGMFPQGIQAYGMKHSEANKYVFMMLTDGVAPAETEAAWQQFREALNDRLQAPVTVGVGSQVGIPGIPQAYLEAQTALSYRFVQGVNRIIYYDQIPLRPDSADEYPHMEMEELQRAIREGSTAKIQSQLSLLVSYIKVKQPPLIVARGMCFEMIRLINGVWRELGLQEVHRPNHYPDIFSIERMETIDEFENLINALSADLSDSFKNQQAPEAKGTPLDARSVDAIMEYIQAHFDSCEFTLQAMADHFGAALPNLGQFFKDRTGQTLLEYTTYLRMEKAKGILTSTQLQLKAVAEEVGYYNVSSFIRRFKQLTGVTPGEYRSQGRGCP